MITVSSHKRVKNNSVVLLKFYSLAAIVTLFLFQFIAHGVDFPMCQNKCHSRIVGCYYIAHRAYV